MGSLENVADALRLSDFCDFKVFFDKFCGAVSDKAVSWFLYDSKNLMILSKVSLDFFCFNSELGDRFLDWLAI